MDEEDGRPGPRARQFGYRDAQQDAQQDASPDARPVSLCSTPFQTLPARSRLQAFQARSAPKQK